MSNIQQSPPGWYPDPYQRYVHRWYDGNQWTAQVAGADGSAGVDPSWAPAGAPTTPAFGQTQVLPGYAAPNGTAASSLAGSSVVIGVAAVGAVLILLGMFALPWSSVSTMFGTTSIKLTDLTGGDGLDGLLVTSKIFWQGGVYGALALTAVGAVAGAFSRGTRIAAMIVAILTLVWLLSVTVVTIGEDWSGSWHVEWNWFEGWGAGLWCTLVGVIAALVSTFLPRPPQHSDI